MMQTGALIVAAGKSSRMGDFKPMLQLGSISIAQRVTLLPIMLFFFEMRTMKLLICLILSGLDWNI